MAKYDPSKGRYDPPDYNWFEEPEDRPRTGGQRAVYFANVMAKVSVALLYVTVMVFTLMAGVFALAAALILFGGAYECVSGR